MIFSSNLFLYAGLPLLLAVYYAAPRMLRNAVLLLASLVFYSWGEPESAWVLAASMLVNHLMGRLIASRREGRGGRLLLAVALTLNLGGLAFSKYWSFLAANVNPLLAAAGLPIMSASGVHQPLGISFFTFQAMSYLIDIYRGLTKSPKNPVHTALYIGLFPQILSGPILRYRDIAADISGRKESIALFASGVRRFAIGLAKKVLLADTLGLAADRIFGAPAAELGAGLAWLGAVCYMLQIYLDFSGYSDMAIGLGRIFGFRYAENFAHPYVSQSIREFWRRWHISLSSWFRDYLYIPLGGSRASEARTGANLLIVFLLCGLWHGASWTFVVWGFYQGFFLVMERLGLERLLSAWPRPFRHAYALFVVLAGWVLFRSESLGGAAAFLKAMCGFGQAGVASLDARALLDAKLLTALFVGAIACTPVFPALRAFAERLALRGAGLPAFSAAFLRHWGVAAYVLLLIAVSASAIATGTYKAFIYFRF